MSSHARLSPSASPRWTLCPGSIRETAKRPAQPSGPAAIDGTHTHTLLEHCIKADLRDPMLFVGQDMTDHEGSFTVETDRAARVVKAINYIKQRKAELGKVSIRAEEKVDPGSWLNRDDLDGTADCQIIGDTVYEVMDYKDGMTPVDPNTPQLRLYAVGGLIPYMSEPGVVPFETVRLTIIQPKIADLNMEPISWVEMTPAELFHWFHEEMTPAIVATDDPDAPLIPGDKQCKWCGARGDCKALVGKALQEAQIMFENVDVAQQAADKEPNELSDEELQRIIEAKPLLLQMIEGAEKEAMRRFENGHRVAGLKVVRNPGRRQWAMSDDEIVERLKKMRMPKDVIFKTSVITPAQVSKARWTMKVKGEEVETCLSERQLKRLEQEYITKSEGSLKVVPESASGKEVMLDAGSIFEGVEMKEPEAALPNWLN